MRQISPQVDEPRPRDRHRLHLVQLLQFGRDLLRQRAWIGPRRLRQHHRSICGQVAMRHIARRLHGNVAAICRGIEVARGDKSIKRRIDMRREP